MNDESNFSTIASSYTPSDYRRARFAANTGDADLPLPSPEVLTGEDENEASD